MKLCKFLFISIIGLATLAENIDLNSLTIRTSVDQSKTYKIKKITISRPGANESKEITIETFGSEKSVIPIDQIIKTPRPSYQGCTHCLKDDVEVEDYYVQLFLNSINPSISCDVKDGVTTGFNFAGERQLTVNRVFQWLVLSLTWPCIQMESSNQNRMKRILLINFSMMLQISYFEWPFKKFSAL